MAYSKVEVASPFDRVLKDHNSRQRCNSMASSASFQKNLKELVRDHLCISVSSDENQDSNSISSGNHQNLTCITNHQEDQNKSDRNQARILDRWAVKQAEEMVSTIPPDSSVQGKNLGASSLVQMWEARLHPAHIRVDRCNSYKYSPRPTPASTTEPKTEGFGSRPVSGSSSSKTSPSSTAENDDLTDKKLESGEITAASTTRNEELVASASSSTRTSGVNEDLFGEGLRIADIIKRLKSDNGNENEQGHSSSICDGNSFSVVVNVNSLKIRGRQAFNDLLVQMEQERQRELNSIVDRHSVSKFSHRGRIQSMLRVRSLERGVAIQNRHREQYQAAQCNTPSHTSRSHHGSTIMSLRDRFCRGIGEDGTSSLTPRIRKEIENSDVKNENNPTFHQTTKSNHCGDFSVTNQQANTRKSCVAISVTNQQATTSKSCKEMEKCILEDHKNDHVVNNDHVNNRNGSTVFQVMTKTSTNDTNFCTSDSLFQTSEAHDDVHEENSEKSDVTSQGTSPEVSNLGESSMDNWEGNEIIDVERDFEARDYDWFSDIARPRSYWEDLRKGLYQQMLTCNSEDNEIKQLLQRKTVSSFLASDFREKMDQMVMSHVQIQASHEDEELEEEGQERMGQLIMSFLQRQSQPFGNFDEEERDDANANAEEQEEGESEQTEEQEPANPLLALSSWNYSHHQQVIDDSEHVPHSPEASVNHPSTEMELKRQIEQLQREMHELRKAVQACLEMQSQLRSSFQPEAARNLNDITRKDRKCCICCDKQVDTFLYRCGHMCTCVRCASELQWMSKKCPICRDPILDVVRAYIDS